MTISTTSSKVTFSGNGSTTAWAFPFVGVSSADLLVYVTDFTGVTTLLGPTQYSVVINTPPVGGLWGIGGTVTYPLSGSPLATGNTLTIIRDVPYTQEISIANQGAFYPQAVEQALDKLELELQQIATEAEYSLKFPLTDPVPPHDLPSAQDRAGGVLGFDTNGQPEIVPNNDVTITVNSVVQVKDSFSEPVLDYLNSPPGSPADGDRYLIGNTPTGAWSGHAGLLVEWDTSLAPPAWAFSPVPKQGQTVYNSGAGINYIYRNTWWNKVLSDTPDALYQDFRDVPDGTLVSGLILASGHQNVPEGFGALTSAVNNGRLEATGNIYNVILYPYKNIKMAFEYEYQGGFTGSSYAVALAAGTKVGGAIITKMVHTEYLYDNYGDMSLWGGPRRTIVSGSPLPYLAWQDVQYHYRAIDNNYSFGTINYAEMYINGCNVQSHNNIGQFLDSYTDPMVSGLLGDQGSDLGYLYFQSGTATDTHVPYIYSILAEPVTPTEDLPNPEFLAQGDAPQIITNQSLTWGGGPQELCRFSSQDFSPYSFEISATIATIGTIPGYAIATKKWIVNVVEYLGTIVTSVQAETTELQTSQNAAVAAVSNDLTVGLSGSNVIFYANPTRTGTDATSTPQVTYRISTILEGATFTG
jgi:hypothetical protein